MSHFFIEVAYKGTHYSGFQIQENANTVQAEIESAFFILQRQPVTLTGSSRTDAGVHALQNYFHFDFEEPLNPHFVYKMNAILPEDVVIKNVFPMSSQAHSRFDAISREYEYRIYQYKNPFLKGIAYYYPYKLDMDKMQEAAEWVLGQTYFFAFSKTNTQVNNFNCTLKKSNWEVMDDILIYTVEGNRFLRGMVRLLTATMLKIGRGKFGLNEFKELFQTHSNKCGFSVPAHGLFLKEVKYPENYFNNQL